MFQYMQRSCKANIETLLRGALLPIALVHVLIAAPAEADCSHCDTSYCPPFNSSNCSYGVVQDECNCCDECAKGPGETCGDVFGSEGICADGYECIVQVLFGLDHTDYYQTPGVCKSSEFARCIGCSSLQPCAQFLQHHVRADILCHEFHYSVCFYRPRSDNDACHNSNRSWAYWARRRRL